MTRTARAVCRRGTQRISWRFSASREVFACCVAALLMNVFGVACTPHPAKHSPNHASTAPSSTTQPQRGHEKKLSMVPQLGHAAVADHLAFSPDDRLLVSAGRDGLLTVWDTASSLVLRSISLNGQATGLVTALDGKSVFVSTENGHLDHLDLANGKKIKTINLSGTNPTIKALAASEDRRLLALCERNDRITLWDTGTWTHQELFAENGPCDGMMFMKDSKSIWGVTSRVADNHAEQLIQFDLESKKIVDTFDFHTKPDERAAFVRLDEQSKRLFFSVLDRDRASRGVVAGANYVYNLSDKKKHQIRTYEIEMPADLGHVPQLFTSIVVSRNDSYVAGDHDGYVRKARLFASDTDWVYDPESIINKNRPRKNVASLALSHNHAKLAVAFGNGEIALLDARDGRELGSLKVRPKPVTSVKFSKQGNKVWFATHDGGLKVWDLSTGAVLSPLKSSSERVDDFAVAQDDAKAATISRNQYQNCISIWSTQTGALIQSYSPPSCWGPIAITPDGKKLITTGDASTIVVQNLAEKNFSPTTIRVPASVNSLRPIGSNLVLALDHAGHAIIVDLNEMKVLGATRAGGLDTGILSGKQTGMFVPTDNVLDVSPDGRMLVAQSLLKVDDLSLLSGDQSVGTPLGKLTGHSGPATTAAFSHDGALLATGGEDCTIRVWDPKTTMLKATLTGHQHKILGLDWSPDSNYIATTSADGTIRVWRYTDGASVTLVTQGPEWFSFNENSYFDTSMGGIHLVGASWGLQGFQIDQVAPMFNRPSKVIETLGLANPTASSYFEKRFFRRLKSLGVEAGAESSDFSTAPTVAIENTRRVDDSRVDLDLRITSQHRELSRLFIDINQVRTQEIALSKREKRLSVTVELSSGDNTIEVSAVDDSNVESLRERKVIRSEKSQKPNLYYLGFGVSSYKNSRINLKFAHLDALDLQAKLKQRASYFGTVHTKVFTNEQVTKDIFAEAKSFLSGAAIDDTVIVFVAGHGVHTKDPAADYYFITHETDLNKLRESAAPFEQIERIFDDTKARKRLLLIDTCESGEFDVYAQQYDTQHAPSQLLTRNRGVVLAIEPALTDKQSTKEDLSFLFERNRLIFHDFRRRSGAVVFVSSRGWESSYEMDNLQNGVFTDTILETLDLPLSTTLQSANREDRSFYYQLLEPVMRTKTNRVDAERLLAQQFTLLLANSLVSRVSNRVAEITQGYQHPVLLQNNPYVQIALPVEKSTNRDELGRLLNSWNDSRR